MPTVTPQVIAIDGPAGSGKSTTARLVAERLAFVYVDTGAMYRAVTFLGKRAGVSWEDARGLLAELRAHPLRFEGMAYGQRIWAGDADVTIEIRAPEISAGVSIACRHLAVRAELVAEQRRLALAATGAVLEGRDIGTVVFPDAPLKVFLEADAHIRAQRRCNELLASGVATTTEHVLADLLLRDHIDTHRANDPLRAAPDAIPLDTSALTIEQQVAVVVDLWAGVLALPESVRAEWR